MGCGEMAERLFIYSQPVCDPFAALFTARFTALSQLGSQLFHSSFTALSQLFHSSFTALSQLFHSSFTALSQLFHSSIRSFSQLGPLNRCEITTFRSSVLWYETHFGGKNSACLQPSLTIFFLFFSYSFHIEGIYFTIPHVYHVYPVYLKVVSHKEFFPGGARPENIFIWKCLQVYMIYRPYIDPEIDSGTAAVL
jgi:hypothetical protein